MDSRVGPLKAEDAAVSPSAAVAAATCQLSRPRLQVRPPPLKSAAQPLRQLNGALIVTPTSVSSGVAGSRQPQLSPASGQPQSHVIDHAAVIMVPRSSPDWGSLPEHSHDRKQEQQQQQQHRQALADRPESALLMIARAAASTSGTHDLPVALSLFSPALQQQQSDQQQGEGQIDQLGRGAIKRSGHLGNGMHKARKLDNGTMGPSTSQPSVRVCQHAGCPHVARGGSLCCVQHGGGKRCDRAGCLQAARGGSKRCIAHGGGKRCTMPNCTKSAVSGGTRHCKVHGGGRRCQERQCGKSAAPGPIMRCIAHGGGRRCMRSGCTKSAVSGGTRHCRAHGGGLRCQAAGCSKSAVTGGSQHCTAHGGGRRCSVSDCGRVAKSKSSRCLFHGREGIAGYFAATFDGVGGTCIVSTTLLSKSSSSLAALATAEAPTLTNGSGTLASKQESSRAQEPSRDVEYGSDARPRSNKKQPRLKTCCVANCKRIARAGSRCCITHGGGKRCEVDGCTKSAVSGGTQRCRSHGGGKRCSVSGCSKSAVGSVKLLCIAHGGGKRCLYPDCELSAVSGGTKHCRSHGGGRRCRWEGCDKSAVSGGTLHCVAHGGGRRCLLNGCDKAAADGGTVQRCVRHGGGRRCKFAGCSRRVQVARREGWRCNLHRQRFLPESGSRTKEPLAVTRVSEGVGAVFSAARGVMRVQAENDNNDNKGNGDNDDSAEVDTEAASSVHALLAMASMGETYTRAS